MKILNSGQIWPTGFGEITRCSGARGKGKGVELKEMLKCFKGALSSPLKHLLPRQPKKRRRIVLRPVGEVYDLGEIQASVSSQYFGGALALPITWFGSGRVPKTSLLFGSYCSRDGLIKVNRVLDSEAIPKFFVSYIVYHEMLHHLYPPKRGKRGRREIHHAQFRANEQKFEAFDQAQQFLKKWRGSRSLVLPTSGS